MAGPLSVTITIGVDLAGVVVGAVLDEPVPQQFAGAGLGSVERGAQVPGGLGCAHRARQHELGDVVDHAAELPGALGSSLELREIGLPYPVRSRRDVSEDSSAGLGQLATLGLVADRLQQPPAGHCPSDR
ncbi:hypothetical protein [Candidatus Poriferisodalis sp.]|uniref:hypothetical protein n=1 Tax=Candidatus Poriferisodalis sp. TaxID=3101277 RepID=UPI003C6F9B9F